MSISTILQKIVLATALVAITAMAQTPYDDGQKALRDKQWGDAAAFFEQAIEADGDKVDASMYWRAYALYEARRDREEMVDKLAAIEARAVKQTKRQRSKGCARRAPPRVGSS